MKRLLAFFLWFAALMTAGLSAQVDTRLHAGWKVEQDDGLGDVYYLYSDGVFVRQGVRRREFVTVGRWRFDDQEHLVIYDQQPRLTSLSTDKLEEIRKKEERYDLVFDSDEAMRWTAPSAASPVRSLKRIRDLPDRTENIYWGLGTSESYQRALLRERGLPFPEKKKPEANQRLEPTPTAVTPAADAAAAPASGAAHH